MTAAATARARFAVPDEGSATTTPEARGLARDEVRMLVARAGGHEHRQVRDLPHLLHPGDLVVVNTSATLPAAVPLAHRRTGQLLHVSTQADDGSWVVEVRAVDNLGPADDVVPGEVLRLPGGVRLRLTGPQPTGQRRLWRAVPAPWQDLPGYLHEHGRPVRYGYVTGEVTLDDLQNAFATHPGSAEMPSAGRGLTDRVLVRLVAAGVAVAPVVLHTGLSSAEAHEPPQPERYTVPEATARLVNGTRRVGRRVVAVGTTVVRALESAADATGTVQPTDGWTGLVLGGSRPARVVDGLLTGLHEPEASHLDLLEAVAGPRLVSAAYDAVTGPDPAYLWHELGDTMLLLP
jgi:S-adenosylmethionine:tRNA ribosyltransferase-isomerase